jgi:hypothetical protein
MKTQLPKIEGQPVHGAILKVSGQISEYVGALAKGEDVYFVGRGPVGALTFKDVDGALVRLHVVKASSLVVLERKDGERMLTEGAMLSDERFGIQTLFNEGDGESEAP